MARVAHEEVYDGSVSVKRSGVLRPMKPGNSNLDRFLSEGIAHCNPAVARFKSGSTMNTGSGSYEPDVQDYFTQL